MSKKTGGSKQLSASDKEFARQLAERYENSPVLKLSHEDAQKLAYEMTRRSKKYEGFGEKMVKETEELIAQEEQSEYKSA